VPRRTDHREPGAGHPPGALDGVVLGVIVDEHDRADRLRDRRTQRAFDRWRGVPRGHDERDRGRHAHAASSPAVGGTVQNGRGQPE
jgi:hypothetical protein